NCPAAAQHAPGCRVGGVEARIRRLHVVQDVREIKVQRAAKLLGHFDFLGNAQIQLPERQATEVASGPDLSIQTEDRLAHGITEYPNSADWAGYVSVGESLLPRSGRAAACANRV